MASLSDTASGIRAADAVASTPSLRKSFTWTLIGNFIYAGCQWGMLSVLARMGSAVVVGQFALGLAITAPVFLLTNLQLRGVQATDAHSRFAFGHYFTLRCLTTLVGLGAVALVVLAARYDRSTSTVVLLVAVAKAVESMSDVIAGVLQKHERLDQVAASVSIRGLCSVAGFGLTFWYCRSLIAALVVLVCSWLLVVVCYDVPCSRGLKTSRCELTFAWPVLRSLTALALPMGIVSALYSLKANCPRYFVEAFLGRKELGVFASLAYLVTVVEMVSNALGQSVATRLSVMFACGRLRSFEALLARMAVCGALLCAIAVPAAMSVGPSVVALIYGDEYARDHALLVLLVIAACANAVSSFVMYGLTATRSFKVQTAIVAGSVAVAGLLSFVLVPRYNLLGAAVSLLASVTVQLLLSAIVLCGTIKAARARAVDCMHSLAH